MKALTASFFLYSLVIFSSSSTLARSESANYYQCQQMCGHTSNGEILKFTTNNIKQLQYLIGRSCENLGKQLWGEMKCITFKVNQNTEPYQDCLNGVLVNKGFLCTSDGSAFILKKGNYTQEINLIYNSSRNSFAESDQILLQNCNRYKTTNPGAEVICGLRNHAAVYSPLTK